MNVSLDPRIIFEDPQLIVLSKPAGLLSQGEKTGDINLVDWLRTYVGRPYIGLVHRLDRNTSGIMVVAKRTKAAQRLTDSLQRNELKRNYLAWVEGDLSETQRWQHFLRKDPRTNRVQVDDAPRGANAKEAVLIARPVRKSLWRNDPVTLAEFVLETGRSHQIRAQCLKMGFPILGDTKYGSKITQPINRPALHSSRLEFPHPISKEVLEFVDPLPQDMQIFD